MNTQELNIIKMIKEFIDSNFNRITSIEEIAKKYYIYSNDLSEKFHFVFECTPKRYLQKVRLQRLVELIMQNEQQKILFYYADGLGFKSVAAFCNFVKRETGMTFLEYYKYVKACRKGIE